MTQSVEEVFTLFMDKLERDDDFFSYYGVDEEEAMELAHERANSYLREAIVYLRRMMELDFILGLEQVETEEVDEDGKPIMETRFIEEVTDDEIDLITEVMLLRYFERDLAKLKAKLNFLASSDLTVLHSPANERTSFVAMLDSIKENVTVMISHYVAMDRLTGKRKKVIDPADYVFDSGE